MYGIVDHYQNGIATAEKLYGYMKKNDIELLINALDLANNDQDSVSYIEGMRSFISKVGA